MKAAEEKIIDTIEKLISGKNGEIKKLSCRDSVRVENNKVIYSLWNTDLFTIEQKTGKKKVFFSTEKYTPEVTGYNWRSKRELQPISDTTKSRINALLWYYCNKQVCTCNYILRNGYSKDSKNIPLDCWIDTEDL